jgi:hypothetical protein
VSRGRKLGGGRKEGVLGGGSRSVAGAEAGGRGGGRGIGERPRAPGAGARM